MHLGRAIYYLRDNTIRNIPSTLKAVCVGPLRIRLLRPGNRLQLDHLIIKFSLYDIRLRPYHVEYTSSRPITEVKQRRARLVLGWVTAWEYRVS